MEEELSELLRNRREKLEEIRKRGVNPYPYRFEISHHSYQLLERKDQLEKDETRITFAGRIMSKRDKGKTSFAHFQDEFGKIQVYVRRDVVGDEAFDIYKMLDISDIVGVKGKVFVTRTGETTIYADEVCLLSKSVRPLPIVKEKEVDGEKVTFDAVSDKELRYRQRYVDLNINPDIKETFRKRSRIIGLIRSYLDEREYLEVETPVLQPMYGGAAARPFKTHHNALDIPLFLRISFELYLKRLVIGGLDRVYEIAKDLRNEGMDRSHNPEFTMIEMYQAYADYNDMMVLAEGMICGISQELNGSYQVTYQGTDFDLTPPWKRISFLDAIKEYSGEDITGMERDDLAAVCKKLNIEVDDDADKAGLIDDIFSGKVEPNLIQPTFIVDYPMETTALAKRHREKEGLVERFEFFINGQEMGNAFTELNDPLEQRRRMEEAKAGKTGDDALMDEDFLRAMEYGMPPTGGMGIGVDRLVMFFTDAFSIRDVLFFPQMRPE